MEYTLAGVYSFFMNVIALGAGSCRPSLVEFLDLLMPAHSLVLEVSNEDAEWIVVLNLPVDPPVYEGDARVRQGLAFVPVTNHEFVDILMVVENSVRHLMQIVLGLELRGANPGVPLPALGKKHLPACVVGLDNFLQHLGTRDLEFGKLSFHGWQLPFPGIIGYVSSHVWIEPLFQERIPKILTKPGDLPQLLGCDLSRMNLDSGRKVHLIYSLNLSCRPMLLTLADSIRGFEIFCPKKFQILVSLLKTVGFHLGVTDPEDSRRLPKRWKREYKISSIICRL